MPSSRKPPASQSHETGRKVAAPEEASARRSPLPPRTGMPAQDSIVSETTLTSPKGTVYRIIKTDEVDEYDEPVRKDRDR